MWIYLHISSGSTYDSSQTYTTPFCGVCLRREKGWEGLKQRSKIQCAPLLSDPPLLPSHPNTDTPIHSLPSLSPPTPVPHCCLLRLASVVKSSGETVALQPIAAAFAEWPPTEFSAHHQQPFHNSRRLFHCHQPFIPAAPSWTGLAYKLQASDTGCTQ